MKNQTHPLLNLLGKLLGKPMAWVLRKQKPITNWLVAKGFSAAFAKWLLTCINLFILISILLAVLPHWVIACFIILVVIACAGGIDIDSAEDDDQPRWKYGAGGYGLYRGDIRIDLGDNED